VTDTQLTIDETARLREAFARVPFASLLGIRIHSLERGAATMLFDVRPELTRMEGILHGGALASLIDTAAAFAVLSLLAPDEQTVTVDLTLHYLRPVTAGQVAARARVVRAGRRLVNVAVEATDSDHRLVASAMLIYAKSATAIRASNKN